MAGARIAQAHSTAPGTRSALESPFSVVRNKSASAVEGNTCAAVLAAEGSESRGMTIPPSNNSNRYRPFCAAKLISARSRPARIRPMPAKADVPPSTAAIAIGH